MKRSKAPFFYAIYFLSGFCSLVYQVVWIRLFRVSIGNTTYASTIVIAIFLGGLALGAHIIKFKADFFTNKFKVYGLIELATAITALASMFLLYSSNIFYKPIFNLFPLSSPLFYLFQSLFAVLVIGIPTILMGMTLPILSSYLVQNLEKSGKQTGKLYAANLLGATTGVLLSSFYLIKSFGIRNSMFMAIALNLLMAILVLYLSRKNITQKTISQTISVKTRLNKQSIALGIAVATSGFISLGYEIIWIRSTAFLLGGFSYVLSSVLIIYLIGNFLGTWTGSYLIKRIRNHHLFFAITLSILSLMGIMYVPWLSSWIQNSTLFLRIADFLPIPQIMSHSFTHSLMLFFAPSFFMGLGFPFSVQAWPIDGSGAKAARVYSLNTIGAVLGVLTTGLFLIPQLGVQMSIHILGILGAIFAGFLLEATLSKSTAKKLIPSMVFILIVMPIVFQDSSSFTTKILNPQKRKIIDIAEGKSSTVTIAQIEHDYKLMGVDGIYMAGDDIHRSAQKMLGHLGPLLHQNPRSVMSIGFGSGETTWCLKQHNIKNIDCIEICPKVTALALKHFSHINLGDSLLNYVNMIHYDARNYVSLTNSKYDIIINGSNIHATQGSATLYTREHFQNAKEKLTTDGLFITKLHASGHPKENFDSILATFTNSYPYTTVWYPVTKPFLFYYLVGSTEPQKWNPQMLNKKLEDVRQSVDYLHFNSSHDFFSCYLGDETDIKRYLKLSPPINSDDQTFIEFNTSENFISINKHMPQFLQILNGNSIKNHIIKNSTNHDELEIYQLLAKKMIQIEIEPNLFKKLNIADDGLKIDKHYTPLLEKEAETLEKIKKALGESKDYQKETFSYIKTRLSRDENFWQGWLISSWIFALNNKPKDSQKALDKAFETVIDNGRIKNILN